MLSLRSSWCANALPAKSTSIVALTCLLLFIAALVERESPLAALVVLVAFTASIGIFHGALDVVLLTTPTPRAPGAARAGTQPGIRSSAWLNLSVYGLAVFVLLVLLASQPAWALVALLLMSAWHFGEVFSGSLHGQHSQWWFRIGERITLGGASVALPRLIQSQSLHETVSLICGPDASAVTLVWQVWTLMLVVWLVVGSLWFVASAARLVRANVAGSETTALATSLGWAGMHTLLLTMVYIALSPVMGFALYFGLYHSPAHVLRVMRAHQGEFTAHIRWKLGAVYLLTVILAVSTYHWVPASRIEFAMSPALLQTYVIVITALSLPHIFLITKRAHEL